VTAKLDFYFISSQSSNAAAGCCPRAAPLISGVKHQTASVTPNPKTFAGELDRLSSLILAAGKDFNDELTVILNHADVLLDMLGPSHPAGPGLVEVQHAVLRCAEITRCLLLLTERARDVIRYARVRAKHAHPGDREFV
jgi:hypothetical protein